MHFLNAIEPGLDLNDAPEQQVGLQGPGDVNIEAAVENIAFGLIDVKKKAAVFSEFKRNTQSTRDCL